jgi:hypothetical protein
VTVRGALGTWILITFIYLAAPSDAFASEVRTDPDSERSPPNANSSGSLTPLIDTLRRTGKPADFAGPSFQHLLKPGEKVLKVVGRGMFDHSTGILHTMHIPEDSSQDVIVFLIRQRGNTTLLLSSSSGFVTKALWREGNGGWLPIAEPEAEEQHRAEVAYWESRLLKENR